MDRHEYYSKTYEDENGCMLWTDLVGRRTYPLTYSPQGKRVSARRASWDLFEGPVPMGHEVHMTCGTPLCVHFGHMKLAKVSRGLFR